MRMNTMIINHNKNSSKILYLNKINKIFKIMVKEMLKTKHKLLNILMLLYNNKIQIYKIITY